MITGFNTEIEFEGQVFHIQTEDKGLSNPTIETLVYTGGQIVCSRKSTYEELVEADTCEESEILRRMDEQHRTLIAEIRDGGFTKEDLQPFGASFVSNRSFDQVVRSFLSEEVPIEQIKLDKLSPKQLRAGQRATLELAVIEETTERPICGARVVVKLCADQSESELFTACTDESGRVVEPYEIPAKPGSGATVVCRADAAGRTAEVRCPVK